MAELIPYLSPQEQEAILDGPALAPPEGVIPQFDNPPNNNALAHGVLSACVAISTVCLLIRAYARVFLFKQLKIEDCMSYTPYGSHLFVLHVFYFWLAANSSVSRSDSRCICQS